MAARRVGDARIEASAHRALGALDHRHGRIQRAREHLQTGLRAALEVSDPLLEAALRGSLAVVLADEGRHDEAVEHLVRTLSLYRSIGNRGNESWTLDNLGVVYLARGDVDEAGAAFEAALELARELGDRRREALVLGHVATMHRDGGRPEAALAEYERALVIHREVGNARGACIDGMNGGMVLLILGRLDDARGQLAVAVDEARALGDRLLIGAGLGALGLWALRSGGADAARQHLDEGERHLRASGGVVELAKLLCTRALLEHHAGETERARPPWTKSVPCRSRRARDRARSFTAASKKPVRSSSDEAAQSAGLSATRALRPASGARGRSGPARRACRARRRPPGRCRAG